MGAGLSFAVSTEDSAGFGPGREEGIAGEGNSWAGGWHAGPSVHMVACEGQEERWAWGKERGACAGCAPGCD